jgi:hypothetical protein
MIRPPTARPGTAISFIHHTHSFEFVPSTLLVTLALLFTSLKMGGVVNWSWWGVVPLAVPSVLHTISKLLSD